MKFRHVFTLILLSFTAVVHGQQFTEPGWFRTQPGNRQVSAPSATLVSGQATTSPGGVQASGWEEFEPSVSIAEANTPEIQALADGLGRDPVRIFNYVHDHVRHVLYFGSKKGAQLTLLERSGNDFDQSALLVALLRAAGYTNAAYQFGWMLVPYDNPDGSHRDLRHWLELSLLNTNWLSTSNYLTELFIWIRGYPTWATHWGTNTLGFQRVWVKLPIGGTNYYLDPSFKVSEPIVGISLTNAMGFSSNALMTAAGGTTTGDYVQSVSESGLRNKLQDYSTNLLFFLQSNHPNASVEQILSGWRIVPSTNTALPDSLLFPTYAWGGTMPVVNWVNQPTNMMASMSVSFAGTNRQWFIPQLRGERLALTFDASGLAQLWQDDILLAQKATSGASGGTDVVLSINHPVGFWDFVNNAFEDSEENDTAVTRSYQRTNSTYNLLYAFEPHWDWLQARRRKLDEYRRQGLSDNAREVVSETLNVMALNWQLQTEWTGRALGEQMDVTRQFYHRMGRMGQELGKGYYLDSYMMLEGTFSRRGYDSNSLAESIRLSILFSYFGSAFEHGIIEQLQSSNLAAASTIKVLQVATTNGQRIFLAKGANWTAGANVRSQLINYANLSTLDALINNNYFLLLPQNGSNRIAGPGSWGGYCYVAEGDRKTIMAIQGGYLGGFVSSPLATVDTPHVYLTGHNQPMYFNSSSPYVPSAWGADPVSMVDGSFHISSTDLSVGDAEPRGLSFSRSYTSSRRRHNLAGMANGWVHNYHVKLAEVSAPEASLGETTPAQMAPLLVAITSAVGVYSDLQPTPKNWLVTALIAKWAIDQLITNGVSVSLGADTLQFIRQPNGTLTPPAGSTMTLTKAGAAYTLAERHGNTFKFNAVGLLTNIVDQYNQPLAIAYNPSNWVSTIKDWKNRTFTFNYSGTPSRLTSVTEGTRTVSFGYTASAGQLDLTSVTDPESKTSTFKYDTNHQIIATLNAVNQVVTSNRYDSFGRVIEQFSQGDANQAWRFLWSGYENIEVDPVGSQRRFFYDDKHRLIGTRDALGNQTQTHYDGQDHIAKTVSPLNETNRFEYDGRHNLLRAIDPLNFTNSFFYDSQDRRIRSVDARGVTNYFGYNAQHRLIGTTNGAGDWVTFTYNPLDGTMATRVDPGGATSYTYDSLGQLSTVTHPGSLGTNGFLNSSAGDILSQTNARGFVTSFQYNARRELTDTVAPTNLTTKVAYDAVGNVQSTTDARGFSSSNIWSATRKLLSTRLPSTIQGIPVLTNIYDTRDWLSRSLNPLEQATIYANDAAQRLISVTDPLLRTTKFAHDDVGRQTGTTNAAQETTKQQWNARGELIQSTDGGNHTVKRIYDASGNQTGLTNRNSKRWQFRFDTANRLTNTISPLGRETWLSYNDRGLLSTVREPSAEITSNFYDSRGRLWNRVDAVGSTVYGYDANNNLTNMVEAGKTNVWTFDAYDRMATYRDADGNLIQYGYDPNGNLTTLVYPGNKTVSYSYDSLNRLTNVTDWANRKTSIEYDLASRVRKITRPNGTVREMNYDAAGQTTNIIERTASVPIAFMKLNWNAAARVEWEFVAPLPHSYTPPTRTMTYDDDNRIATFNGGSVTYDPDGNLTSGPLTNTTLASYSYDARNRLLSASGLSYGYDCSGNRVAITNGGSVTRLVVNPNAALSQVLMRVKNGVTNYYVYGIGLLYEADDAGTTRTYHYDSRGSTIAITDGSAAVTDRIEYSAYGSITYRTGNTDTPFLYNGRYGVQTDSNGLLHMRARYYNSYICRFLNPDPIGFSGGLNFYAYADGNPISLLDPFGLGAMESMGSTWLRNAKANFGWAFDIAYGGVRGTAGAALEAIGLGLDLAGSSFGNPNLGDYFHTWGEQESHRSTPAANAGWYDPNDPATQVATAATILITRRPSWGAAQYEVAIARELRNSPVPYTQAHHVPQVAQAETLIGDYNLANRAGNEAAIRLSISEHSAVSAAQAARPNVPISARDLLADDIRILRSHTDAPNSALQQLIQMNKELHPYDFAR